MEEMQTHSMEEIGQLKAQLTQASGLHEWKPRASLVLTTLFSFFLFSVFLVMFIGVGCK